MKAKHFTLNKVVALFLNFKRSRETRPNKPSSVSSLLSSFRPPLLCLAVLGFSSFFLLFYCFMFFFYLFFFIPCVLISVSRRYHGGYVQTSSNAHPVSYPVGTGVLFPGVNAARG
jgi:hypothetical protein